MRKLASVTLALVICFFSVSASATKSLGLGTLTCERYLAAKKEDKKFVAIWLTGYLSAQSEYDNNSYFQQNLSKMADEKNLLSSLDSSCRLNTSAYIVNAAYSIYKQLGGTNNQK